MKFYQMIIKGIMEEKRTKGGEGPERNGPSEKKNILITTKEEQK